VACQFQRNYKNRVHGNVSLHVSITLLERERRGREANTSLFKVYIIGYVVKTQGKAKSMITA